MDVVTGYVSSWLNSLRRRAAEWDAGARPGRETARLRLVFLVPLLLALLVVVGIWVLALYFHERKMVNEEVARTRLLMERMYFDDVAHEAGALEAVAEVIGRDHALRQAL